MTVKNEGIGVPLASVRAFEAAARWGSYTAAARELGLTQSAVSRHMRALEDRFALRLFERRGRAVVLTASGEAYFRPVAEAMRLLRSASGDMRRRRQANRLTVSLLPSVAALWLAPRLADFVARNPSIELQVHASRALLDFGSEGIDLGIRYGLGTWPDLRCELLAGETLTPVCAPDFAGRHRLGTEPRALLSLPLLSDDIVDGWADWLVAAEIEEPILRAGPKFDDSASLYHAAASGLGVALGRSLLVERALAEGRLVAPFDLSVPATYGYWLAFPDRGEASPAARLFAQWLREQMSARF